MTLLVTFMTSKGIVFAADSAITMPGARGATRHSKQRKFVRSKQIGIHGGIVGYFGLAVVDQEPMDVWLRRKLNSWMGTKTVADVGQYLCEELERDVPRGIREHNASGFHIGGFEQRSGVAVPVMQHISNIYKMDDAGRYSDFRHYQHSEHFPSHHSGWKWGSVPPSELRLEMRLAEPGRGLPIWFRNGDLPFAAPAWEGLTAAMSTVVANGSGARAPDTLRQWELLADAMVRTNGRLYAILKVRGEPLIEGPFHKASIPWP